MSTTKKLAQMVLLVMSIGAILVSCAPAAQPTQAPQPPQVITQIVAGTPIVITATPASTAAPVSQTPVIVSSWRYQDVELWQKNVIPPFEAAFPSIQMLFEPVPNTYYEAELESSLQGGTAADIFNANAFDTSLSLYNSKYVKPLNGLPGLDDEFSHISKGGLAGWSTPDGKVIFGMPVASVMHGVFYNKDIFTQLNLQVPKTMDDFMAILAAVKKDGRYIPLANGTADSWADGILVYDNMTPAYRGGEAGRKALVNGTAKFTDPGYVAGFTWMTQLVPYLPPNYQSVGYTDGEQLFISGKAAMRLVGSWEVASIEPAAKFQIGAFPPPPLKAGDKCIVDNLVDTGFMINAATTHPDQAEQIIQWFGSKDFAQIYTNAVPGFYPLSDYPITINDPLAAEVFKWAAECDNTTHINAAFLDAQKPDLGDMLFTASQNVMNLTQTPQQAAATIQKGLDSWYKPPVPPIP
jgi:raffinose/stachyose/melibiose transport system substrate-binding protein